LKFGAVPNLILSPGRRLLLAMRAGMLSGLEDAVADASLVDAHVVPEWGDVIVIAGPAPAA
jgi:hypothetical protein